MSVQPSILVLEDDAASAGLLADALQVHAPGVWAVMHAMLDEDARHGRLPCVPGKTPTLVITGAETARHLAEPTRPYGLIALIQPDERSQIRELVTLGVDDVLVRVPGYLDQVPAAAAKIAARRGSSRTAHTEERRIAELKAMLQLISEENRQLHTLIDRLETMALSDPLTGLANRRAMQGRLEEEFAASVREGHDVTMMMIDVDGLKGVNDRLGHATGDELITLVAKTLIDGSRRSDITCRVGGDEFVIILPRTKRANARPVAERLCESFRKNAAAIAERLRYQVGGETTRELGISIGLASRLEDGSETGEELLARADVALYKAKGQRLGVAVFSDSDAARGSGIPIGKARSRNAARQITHKAA